MNTKKWVNFFANLYNQASLRSRLTILVLAIAVPLLIAATIFIYSRAVMLIEQNSNEQLKNTNRLLATTVSVWLDAQTKNLQNFVSLPDIVSMEAGRQKPLLQRMAAAYPYLYLISTTDLKGVNVARNDEVRLKNYSDRFWFKEAKAGAPITFESVISRTIGKPGMVISMPIKNETGRIIGVGMFAVDVDNLSHQVRVTRLGKTGFAYLVGNKNRVIAHPDPTYANELRDLSDYPPVAVLRQGARGQVSFKDGAGRYWRAYVDDLDIGWGIIVQQEEDELLGAQRLFKHVALAIIIGAVLILTSTSWWIVRRSLRPIDVLTKTVTGLASSNFSHSDLEAARLNSLNIRTRDEVGTLVDSFYKMAVQLQATLSSLEQELIEHKRADEELQKEKETFFTILKNDPSGVALIDKDGLFQYVNPEFTNITGYTIQDVPTAREWYQRAYPDVEYRKKVIETWNRNRVSEGRSSDVAFTITCKDGQTKDIEFRMTFIEDGAVIVLNDVTERRKAEKALQESEEKYRNIFENAVEGIFQTTPDGRFLNVNPAFSRMHGYESPREMMMSVTDIEKQLYVNPDDRSRFQKSLETQGIVEAFEIQLYEKDGGKIWVSLKARAVRNIDGAILYYEGMAENITERKRVEEEIRQQSEQLRALTWRMSEFEESERKIISRELHDQIGQNLGIIGLNLNILQTLIPENSSDLVHSRLKDSLALIKQTAEGIRNLMADLRSPVLDDYGLVAAIHLYGKQCASRTGINVIVQGDEPDPRLPAHVENAMFRIAQEALTNVIKHAQASQATVSISKENKKLFLSVMDNGIGYNPADLAGQNGRQGWGLVTMTERALSVGGTCHIESNQGQGTYISVKVPL